MKYIIIVVVTIFGCEAGGLLVESVDTSGAGGSADCAQDAGPVSLSNDAAAKLACHDSGEE